MNPNITLPNILTLLNAGYTKEEISALISPGPEGAASVQVPVPTPVPVADPGEQGAEEHVQAPVPAPAQAPVPAPAQGPAQAPVPAPAQAPAQAPEATMADVLTQLSKLTSAIQANAIAQSVMPQTPPKGAEDMLAEIIRPTMKARGI